MKITLNISLFRSKRRDKTENHPGQPLFVTSSLRLATRLSGRLSVSTVRNYHTALQSFSTFLDGTDIPVRSLTPHLVSLYADWLTERGISANTASCYLRSLRALYNRMARRGRMRRICPFANVFTGNSPTEKRSIPVNALQRLHTLQLPKESPLRLYRDLFLFCFYAMGMPFADVVRLRRSQVHGDHIVYRRQKTGRIVRVQIEPCMRAILRRYQRSDSLYLFPILPIMANKLAQQRAYRSALGRYNRALKRIAVLAGIRNNLSSYVPRHTWATQAYAHKVELAVIAQALGHVNTRATWTYVRPSGISILAAANKKIIKEVIKNTSAEEVFNGS